MLEQASEKLTSLDFTLLAYSTLPPPPGGQPRWRPQFPVLLYWDRFVLSAEKPLLTHFKNILDLVSSFSGSHFKIMDQWTFSHEILHHFCVLWSLWTWIASSWHLCYVVFLDWPRSFPRKWWNLVSLCVYILLYLAVCTLAYSVGKHPPTDKLLTDLNKH